MDITSIIFYFFAALLVISAIATVSARNPVHGALFLVCAFVASAGIWIMMQAEFLGLVLILVYVGAVMTLFLFVVMMLNLDQLPPRDGFKKFWPFAVVIIAVIVGLVFTVTTPAHFALAATPNNVEHSDNYSNIAELGNVLYVQYVYAFELAAVILLVAIVAAISLAFRGWGGLSKRQNIRKQVQTDARDRIRLVRDVRK